MELLEYKIHHYQNVLCIPRAQDNQDNRKYFSHADSVALTTGGVKAETLCLLFRGDLEFRA